MKRRSFLAAALAALSLPLLPAACERMQAALRIASHSWPGYEFLFLAGREGWFTPQDARLIETGSATASLRLLAAGEIDGATLTLDELVGARRRGLPLVAVLVFDISMGADVLLARPGIETLAQLAGRRIGYEPSAVGALMLHRALEAAGLTTRDVVTVPVTFDRHLEAWRSGELDALITFEPVASRLQAEAARRLFDSSRIPETIFDVLAVTHTAVQDHSGALRRLVAAHFRALAHFRKNPSDTAYRMAEHLKLSPKEVIAAYKGLELPNERRNRQLLRGDGGILLRQAKVLTDDLLAVGLLGGPPPDLTALVTADFIPRETLP